MSALRPPPVPSKTRRPAPPRAAKPPPDVDSLASNLAQLQVGQGARAPAPSTCAAASARRPAPTLKPLGRSTAANRQLPSTAPPAAAAAPRPRTAPARPKESEDVDDRTAVERARDAMKSVNTSLASLGTLNKSGYRAGSSASPSTSTPSSRSSSAARTAPSSATLRAGAAQNATRDKVEQAAKEASRALRELRALAVDGVLGRKQIEVEKAAGGVVAHLVEMEMYRHAVCELSAMRASLLRWWSSPATSPPSASTPLLSHILSFSIPLPPASFLAPPSLSDTLNASTSRPTIAEVVPLVLAIQQYLLGALFRSPDIPAGELATQLVPQMSGAGGPLEWHALWAREGPAQELEAKEREGMARRLDAMMTSVFATVTKGCAGLDGQTAPEHLLSLRTYALLCYASTSALTSPDKLSAFHDQLRKVLLLYGRAAEGLRYSATKIGAEVKAAFEQVVRELERRGLLGGAEREDRKWRELCEVVLHIARRADDLAFVSRVSALLGLSPSSTSSSFAPSVSPAVQSSQLCTKLANALALFESYQRSPAPFPSEVADVLRRALGALPLLTPLRLLPISELDHGDRSKIDKLVDRMRFVLARHAKRGVARLDLLMATDSETPPMRSEVDDLVREVLDAVALHAEAVAHSTNAGDEVVSPKERDNHVLGAVDSLLIFAYSSVDLSSPSPPSRALALLDRARALVDTPEHGPQLERAYSLRTLASAWYNIGGTLFNAGRAADAVGFVRRACEIGERVLDRARREGLLGDEGDVLDGIAELKLGEETADEEEQAKRVKARGDMREAARDFERLMGRRWELLALAQHQLGDKKAAYDAYIASALSQPATTFDTLTSDASKMSSSDILVAHAPLYKVIQRLTRLAVFDLLLGAPSVPITVTFSNRVSALSSATRGALLEMQLAALEPYTDKEEARGATHALLAVLRDIYDSDEYPMRRSRVLVKRLETCSTGALLEKREAVEELAEEVKELCEREHIGADAALRSYAPQYLALSHLFLAFHAHASQAPTAALNETVARSARQAIAILRTALDGELPLSPSAAQAKRTSPVVARTAASAQVASPPKAEVAATRTRRTTRAAATPAKSRTPAVSTRRAAAPAPVPPAAQVTPPRKARGKLDLKESTRTPGRALEAGKLLLDDVEKVFALLESMVSFLGTLGEILLKIAYLKFLRRLSVKLPQRGNDAYVTASVHLAREYLRLGKTSRAGIVLAQAESRMQTGARSDASVSPVAQVSYWLAYAECLALVGSHDRSAHAYDTALSLADALDDETAATSTTAKIVERTLLLQRASLAASVCSVILQRRGELSRAIGPAMQAMRLGTRALNNISRIAPAPAPASAAPKTDSTFTGPPQDHKIPLADAPPINERKSGTTLPGGVHAGVSWQLAEGLFDAILRVASLHFVRGTPKSADFFAQQALDLAEDLGAPRQMARALSLQADVRLHWGKLDEAAAGLEKVEELLGSTTCPEAAEFRRLQADLHQRACLEQEAFQFYLAAQSSLDAFVTSAGDGDAGHSPVKQHTPGNHFSPAQRRISGPTVHFAAFSPSPAARAGHTPDWVLPSAQAYLLRMQISLLRMQKKHDEAYRLVRRLARLAALEEDKADELGLLAANGLQDLLIRCASDPVLGMLPDSVLSMPVLGTSAPGGAVVKIGTPRTGPNVLNAIKEIEALLARAITLSSSRALPVKLRELATLSTTLRAMQASLGKVAKRSSATVAHILDLGAAVTLRREMLDAIEHKLTAHVRHDDLTWPPLDPSAAEENDDSRSILRGIRERYRFEAPEPTLVDAPLSSLLPPSWSALTLHLTPERDSLILCRHRRDADPIVFKLPLDRLARREGDEDEAFTHESAANELRDIIAASNAGTQSAKHVDGKEARAAWWAERKELDQRLGTLLQTMEDAWLGAFKAVFYDARQHDPNSFTAFKGRVERILKRSMVRAAGDKRSTRFKLDDSIVECLAALPSTSREEDLEDLFYFMAESFQFSGVPLACDETDVDQVVVDLREALEELHGTKSAPRSRVDPDEHTFLVLDKDLQAFPWESLPCLQGRSVSRLPSLAFLRDRLDYAAARAPPGTSPHDVVVDPARTSFVLNPGGDLKNTQKTFEPWLEEQVQARAWSGVTARAPMEEEVKSALLNKELFLFFGHGGAEQYIRSQIIRHLPRCAVTMLWGCSSGLLKDQGDFEPVGTPYHYMIAGCPALVANLWDVTDKDIDKFALSVFQRTGIATAAPGTDATPHLLSLTAAVAQSRSVCNLRYLNGAAPVVYGIPVRFATAHAQD